MDTTEDELDVRRRFITSKESGQYDHLSFPANRDEGLDDSIPVCLWNTEYIMHYFQTLAHRAEEYALDLWSTGWEVVDFQRLPSWLKDNDLLIRGHRRPLHTLWACFSSVFRIHTETGNIWTHLLGFAGFVAITICIFSQPTHLVQWQEKLICSSFFVGAMLCLGFSCLFHTALCHSPTMSRFLNKLDYCGIAFLVTGSFLPYLYYSFYCTIWLKIFYSLLILTLGCVVIIISMFDRFAHPEYRVLRALSFIALGLSAVIPCSHAIVLYGLRYCWDHCSTGWLIIMAVLYISGASMYALRIPERLLPGYFDIWLQSHQILHVCVVIAALAYYHGLVKLVDHRLTSGDCRPPSGYPFPPHEYDQFELLRPFFPPAL